MTRLVQVLHILTSGELVSARTVEADSGHLAVPSYCGHCTDRPPFTVPPALGYDSAVVYVHDGCCPRVRGAVGRRQGGAQ